MDIAAIVQGLLIPFLGTSLGASLVFFLRGMCPGSCRRRSSASPRGS